MGIVIGWNKIKTQNEPGEQVVVAEEVAAVVQMKTSQTTLIIKHFPTITDHNVYVYVYLCCGSICVYLYDVYLCVLCIYVLSIYACVYIYVWSFTK
jgi:hypothetical protein